MVLKFLNRRKKKIMLVAMVVFVLAMVSLLLYALMPVNDRNFTAVVNIPKGTSFLKCVDILEEAGFVEHKYLFYLLVFSKNAHRQIRAGEYELSSSMSPMDIINKLVRGEIKLYRVTFPEDFTLKEIAARLASYRLVDENKFLKLCKDTRFLKTIGIEADSAEGYLYPDTYFFERTMEEAAIIRILVNRFWKAMKPEMLERAKELGMSVHEVVTLASLIGKESGFKHEKSYISAVFHNRLKKGMRLQCDPTAVYDLEPLDGKITRAHLRRDTPYNTYRIRGLPPGPIGNPGADSLQAALYPASVNYLYFVSNNDGSHKFSSNLTDHNKAVLQYQAQRNKLSD